MRPYPWSTRKRFMDRRRFGHVLHTMATVLTWAGALLCAPTLLARAWAHFGFDRTNDLWWKRGLGLVVAGLVAVAVTGFGFYNLGDWLMAWYDALASLGPAVEADPVPLFVAAVLMGAPAALILMGLAALMSSYDYEYSAERWRERTRPTWRMRARRRKNTMALRHAAVAPAVAGWIRLGVICDDLIPWRTPRYGMVVERPLKGLGHGVIVGASDTGKTVTAIAVAHYSLAGAAGVAYVDFKASRKTQKALRASASAAGVPFYSFDLGLRSGEDTWYDPLAWDGKPNEKASLLMDAFDFASGGGADHYKPIASNWLTLQFEVLALVGLGRQPAPRGRDPQSMPLEGHFDYLLATATPAGLLARIAHLREAEEGTTEHNAYVQIHARAGAVKAQDLTSLRNNILSVVNAAGARLRPSIDGAKRLSFAQVAKDGGLAYVGLSATTDTTALKVIGSLALRDMTALAGQRMRAHDLSALRPLVVLVDEASRLGDRAVVMDDLFAQAREGSVWLWNITQSLAPYPSGTRTEMGTNASTFVVYRVQDPETATEIAKQLGTMPTVTEMVEEDVKHRFLQAHSLGDDGDARITHGRGPYMRPDTLQSLPNHHAHIWFTGTQNRPTRKAWRSRRVTKRDEIQGDAPLVAAGALDLAINPPEPTVERQRFNDVVGVTTGDGTAPAGEASANPVESAYSLGSFAQNTPEQDAQVAQIREARAQAAEHSPWHSPSSAAPAQPVAPATAPAAPDPAPVVAASAAARAQETAPWPVEESVAEPVAVASGAAPVEAAGWEGWHDDVAPAVSDPGIGDDWAQDGQDEPAAGVGGWEDLGDEVFPDWVTDPDAGWAQDAPVAAPGTAAAEGEGEARGAVEGAEVGEEVVSVSSAAPEQSMARDAGAGSAGARATRGSGSARSAGGSAPTKAAKQPKVRKKASEEDPFL